MSLGKPTTPLQGKHVKQLAHKARSQIGYTSDQHINYHYSLAVWHKCVPELISVDVWKGHAVRALVL